MGLMLEEALGQQAAWGHQEHGHESGGPKFSSPGPCLPKAIPPFDCATYSMMWFKVLPCLKKYNHDWTACPGAHPGERARRRCLLVYRYGAKVCPDMQMRGVCPRGESCYMTHGMFEYYMHPLKYKTKMCKSGASCRRHYCFFSHAPEEMRESSSIPEEWQLQILPDGTISSSSTATVLSCLPPEARPAAQAAILQLPQIMQMFESGADRLGVMPSAQHMQQGVQRAAAWGGAVMAGSAGGAQYDTGVGMPGGGQAEALAGYGPPGMLATAQQQGFAPLQAVPLQQQQQDFLQGYGPACGLQGSAGALMVVSPQQAGGGVSLSRQVVVSPQQAGGGVSLSSSSSQHSPLLPAQMQQPPMGAVSHAAAVAGLSAPYMVHSSSMMHPATTGWASGGQPLQLQYGGAGGSMAMAARAPQMLNAQASLLAAGQPGAMLQQPGMQMQSPYLQQTGAGGLVQQLPAANLAQPGTQIPLSQQQQQAASVPLVNPALMLQQPRAQVLPGGMVPAGVAAGPAQQSLSVATSEQLVQQLQALGLNTTMTAMSQQL